MKTRVLSLLFLGLVAVSASAETVPAPIVDAGPALVTRIGILPGFKRGQILDEGEANPYAAIVKPKSEPTVTGAEGAKIAAILEGLPFSGLVRNEAGEVRAVLLGDLRLENGRPVPQLVEGQTDELFVDSLSATEIVISWRREAGRVVSQPREWRRKVDLSPKINVVLPGQAALGEATTSQPKKVVTVSRGRVAAPGGIVPTSGLPSENQ